MEQMRELYLPNTKFGVTTTAHVMVEEGYSGSLEDVSAFIIDGLQRMKVGTPDGPPFLTIVGDEQVFRQVNELRKTCPEEFGLVLAQLGVSCDKQKHQSEFIQNDDMPGHITDCCSTRRLDMPGGRRMPF